MNEIQSQFSFFNLQLYLNWTEGWLANYTATTLITSWSNWTYCFFLPLKCWNLQFFPPTEFNHLTSSRPSGSFTSRLLNFSFNQDKRASSSRGRFPVPISESAGRRGATHFNRRISAASLSSLDTESFPQSAALHSDLCPSKHQSFHWKAGVWEYTCQLTGSYRPSRQARTAMGGENSWAGSSDQSCTCLIYLLFAWLSRVNPKRGRAVQYCDFMKWSLCCHSFGNADTMTDERLLRASRHGAKLKVSLVQFIQATKKQKTKKKGSLQFLHSFGEMSFEVTWSELKC